MARRRPRMAGPPDGPGHPLRPGRDPPGDLPDRGLLRQPVAVLLRAAVRRGQGDRGGVPRQGHDLLGAAVRHRRVHEQRDRRDQVADRVHGRLPDDDHQGHVHHQRHRAGRRLPAGPVAGRVLRPRLRQDRPARRSSRSRSSRPGVPGSSSTSTSATPSGCASTASAASRSPCCSRRWVGTPSGSASGSPGRRCCCPPWRRTTSPAPTRRCWTSTASCVRVSRRPGVRADPAGEPVLQGQALRPGQGRPVQAEQEARPEHADLGRHADRGRPGRHGRVPAAPARRPGGAGPSAARACRSRSTTSTTSATAGCAPSAS